MASSVHVTLLLLAAVVLDLAMAHKAFKSHHKRSPLVGGLEDVDTSDEGVQQAVNFAIQEYNNQNNDLNVSRVVQVVRARQQVVAGTNYYLDLEIGRTTCAKDEASQDDCQLTEEPTQHCSFVVHSVPWEDSLTLRSVRCHRS